MLLVQAREGRDGGVGGGVHSEPGRELSASCAVSTYWAGEDKAARGRREGVKGRRGGRRGRGGLGWGGRRLRRLRRSHSELGEGVDRGRRVNACASSDKGMRHEP